MNCFQPTFASGRIGPKRISVFSALLLLAVAFYGGRARAQCTLTGSPTTWSISGNGNFSTSGDWSSGVPNGSTNACITNGTSTVTLDTNESVANLQLATGNILTFNTNTSLTVDGPQLVNAGQIIMTGGSNANAFLNIGNNVTLSGGGTVTLAYNGSGAGAAYIQQSGGSYTLTNQSTIQGAGVIGNGGLTVINDPGATIDANTSGQSLALNGSGGVTNGSLLEATSGGTLVINTTVNNSGGNITAGNGSTVAIDGATILGGTLNNTGTGTLETIGTSTLNGSTGSGAITINGTYTGGTSTTTNVLGTIINNGSMQFTGGSNANSFLNITGNTTLSGGGTVTLAYNGSGAGAAYIQQSGGSYTLTNQSTIQGAGVIGNGGLTVINAPGGLIDANTSGQTLTLNASGGVTNAGLLEATNGGTLAINNTTVNNSGANITANGGTVQVSGTTIQGGTLNTLNGGTLEAVGTSTLDGSTQGALTLSTGSTYTGGTSTTTNVLGAIVNNGNMEFTGGSNANSFLNITGNTTLSGGGTVTLAYNGSGAGAAYIQQSGGSFILTNESTIQGAGVIGNGGLTVINDPGATIDANTSGQSLALNGSGGVTNGSLLEATSGGTLVINTTVNNSGGNITAGNGSTVAINGATILGGTLNNTGTGTLETIGTSTLNGSTGSGAITINGTYTGGTSTTTNVLGTIINNGSMQFTGGSNANSFLNITGNTTLSGGGTVTLAYNGSGAGAAYIQQSGGSYTLTNQSTIQGAGVIGNGGLTVINAPGGLIDANTSGQTLTLNPAGGLTNTGGMLEASNGGTLSIASSTIDNKNGTIEVNGASSAVQFANGATIQGGTLTTTGGGSLGVPGGSSITLDGSTQGALTLSTGSTYTGGTSTTTNVLGAIVNNGNMEFTGGSNANSFLNITGNTALSGGGTVTLAYNGSGAGAAYIQQSGGSYTLTNQSTIQGAGVIGNGGLTVINAPGGLIDANTSGQTLTLNPAGGLTNTGGMLEASNGGTLSIASSTIDNKNGTIEVNGASSAVQFANGATIQGGTLTTTGGGSLGVPGGSSITLDGSTQGALTLSTGSTYTGGTSTTTNVLGAIVNNGNMEFTGGSNANSFLNITGNTALSGGGTVTLAYNGSGAGAAYIQQSGGSYTLTNQSTIQGAGVIGNGGLTVINDPGATIDANTSGQSLALNGSGGVTNGSLLEATSGGTLVINTTVNNSGGNITAGNGSTVAIDGATILGGTLNNTGTGTLETIGTSTLNGSTGSGAITINGTYTGGTSTTTNVLGTIINNGSMQFTGGSNANSFLNITGNTTLSGGGTVTLAYNGSGAGAAYIQQSGGSYTLTNQSTIQGAGIINVSNLLNQSGGAILANVPGQSLQVIGGGGLTNNGTVQVNSGSTLQVTSAFTQTGGSTDVAGNLTAGAYQHNGGETTIELGGTISAPTFNVTGGGVQGNGTIVGAVAMDGGTLTPGSLTGNTPGTLTITGSFNQTGGAFNELINGTTSNGLLAVSGGTSLGGTLQIDVLDGFNPTGDPFDILNYSGTLSGAWTNAPTSGFVADGFDWGINYTYNGDEVVLTAEGPAMQPTPEPGTLLLFGTGLLCMGGYARRKRGRAKTVKQI